MDTPLPFSPLPSEAFTAVRPYCDWIALSTGGEVTCYDSEVLLDDVGINE